MRRGAKLTKAKVKAKPSVARKTLKSGSSRVRDLEKRLAEALEQQTATSEILRVISSSPTELQPVFDAIASSATRLCDAAFSVVFRFDGEMITVAADDGRSPGTLGVIRSAYPSPPGRQSISARAILERRVICIADAQGSAEHPQIAERARAIGYRSILSVPMLRGNAAIGAINVARLEAIPFTDQQIALLQTFADQAVIAIENVRLFNETKEALEQQTATAEILQVISGSPTDLQPVFDTIVRSAGRLCDGFDAVIYRRDGDTLHLVAHEGPIPTASMQALIRGWTPGRAVLDGHTVHIADIQAEVDEFPEGSEIARRVGNRTVFSMPLMRKDGLAIGAIMVRRTEARLFTDRQVALLKTFADQAVIAIENVRLFKELEARNSDLTTALDTQTATSDILRVISRSQTDVQPVFDAILTSAARLLDAYSGALTRVVDDQIQLAAFTRTDEVGDAAVRVAFPQALQSQGPHALAIRSRTPLNIADAQTDPRLDERERARAHVRGYRSRVLVPLLSHEEAIGAISVARREAGGFTDDEIALLQTFADQAVIAIENVRLFNELEVRNRELTDSLTQQTATAEILRVISSSPTDIQPVLEAVTASAARLCECPDAAIFLVEGQELRLATHLGPIALGPVGEFSVPLVRGSLTGRATLERRTIQLADHQAEEVEYPEGTAVARRLGVRTMLTVPLLRSGEAIGVIALRRTEVRLFTDPEIALLRTFADQAVIAIENVRLFTELQEKNRAVTQAYAQVTESLEQQTATSEILQVISSSPTDVQPTFEAIAASARRLCEAAHGMVFRFDGELIHLAAHDNLGPDRLDVIRSVFPIRPSRGSVTARAILTRAVVHVRDRREDLELEYGGLSANFPNTLSVPLLRDGVPLGAITVTRAEIGLFSARQIALLQTFADQAVIAIENVRLFTELQASNRGLVAALDQQTATSDILRVISRSQTNVQPVFDAILDSAVRLLRGYSGVVTRMADDQIELAALTTTDDAGDAATRVAFPQSHQSDGPHAQAMRDRTSINITDAQTDPRVSDAVRANARARGNRSLVIVPLLRHDEAVGTIAVTRREPGGFADEEIALLKTFADQAVIAIENARLLTELQARTQELSRSVGELQALGEVGQAISSTLDLETVLTTIVSRAVQLSALDGGVVFEYDEGTEEFVQRAATDPGGALAEAQRTTRIRKGEGVVGQTAITLEPAQVPDIAVPAAYEGRLRETLVESGIRAILAVPMIREGQLIGCLGVTRNLPGEFPTETIELLRTFATQSALAIQNARLFHEIADKSRQLEAASRHKSEFLANMSHELRTPLNAIIGFSEVLNERMFGELNEKQAEYLKDIYASGQHLLSLINDILDLSKIEAGRMELEVSDFDLPSAIDNALTLVRERATRRGITLGHTIDEQLGMLRGDERKVKQVLLNLLSNALKFTPEGGRINVSARTHDEVAEIAVTDTGVGIAPEDQEAVFEEFRQVGTADKKVEGTGLGLALSRKFIELHGGRIWVKSQVGHGSTFTFTLPVRREE